MTFDFLIIGAGFAGSILAERLAVAGKSILIIDKRSHIGGNAFDEYNSNGILIHRYGPHIFHTNSKRIFEYLSNFTKWRFYEHKVLASVEGQLYPFPINQTTVNRLYRHNFNQEEMVTFFERVRESKTEIKTSEDVVLNSVGRDLYEKFFKGYTKKQWGLDPSQLSASVAARIPFRTNQDDRYFTDEYQVMPLNGYHKLFENILSNSRIKLELNTLYDKSKFNTIAKNVIYTGPIDSYFEYCFGKLPYRSLSFEHSSFNREFYQQVGTINFPNDYSFTRITEFKHLTGQINQGTSIVKEFPCAEGEPYYPIPRPENQELFLKYKALASAEKNVFFVGRLAQYKYYNMDQVVGAALTLADSLTFN